MLAQIERLYCVLTCANDWIVGNSVWLNEDAVVSDLGEAVVSKIPPESFLNIYHEVP